MVSLTDHTIRLLRLRAQWLVSGAESSSPVTVAEVVKAVGGIQAQDMQAAMLSVRVRSAGLTAGDVEQARLHERSVLRTWAMRGTLHLIATEDAPWLLALLGPIFAASDRRRRLQLGLDDEAAARGVQVIREALAKRGPLTRVELLQALTAQGIHEEGQGVIHLIALAALQGWICLGPDRGAKPTYVLLEDWVKGITRRSELSAEEAFNELARCHLAAFGPALPEDFAAWSGVPMRDVRAAWKRLGSRHELLEVDTANGPAWLLKSRANWLGGQDLASPSVRLLPAFDTFWMGYRRRDLLVAPQYARRINAGGGILHPTLLLDGHAEGIWKIRRLKTRIEIAVEPFESLANEIAPSLEAEAADVGRFLGVEATLRMGGH